MPVDLGKWVEGLKLPEAERKVVLDALGKGGEDALKYIEGNQLRQDEFSKKMNDLQTDIQKKEKDLEAKIANEDKYHNSLATWDTKRKKELEDATTARKKAEDALAAARDRVTALATEHDLPADEIQKLFEGAPVARQETHERGVDPKELDNRYVTRESFQIEAKSYARLATMIPALERQHFKLFGDAAEAPDWEKLIEETTKLGGAKTLKQVYEETYKVSEKREELRNADIDARVKKAREEGEEAARAKILADNPTIGQSIRSGEREGSPVLALATKQRIEADKGKPPIAAQSPVAAAVAAFNSGKYKTGDKAA